MITQPQSTKTRRVTTTLLVAALLPIALTSCHRTSQPAPDTAVVIIESSPNNLDLRQGTDAQSERVGALIFDPLVRKDARFHLQPWLAQSWEQPNPLTWIFHLRSGVHFQDGRPLAARDVVWTIESLIDPHLTAGLPGGALISAKSGSFASVDSAEARDPLTVVLHLKHPDPGLLFNLSDGLFGVVPWGAGGDLGLHPIGSGPFRFVSQAQDKEVVLERTPSNWSDGLVPPPPEAAAAQGHLIQRLRFAVIPDTITSALEMQKGSADLASNVLTPDMVHALEGTPNLGIETGPGSVVYYLNFNTADPLLADRRVRQAIAFAIDRQIIVDSLWHGHAQLADTLLPPTHWAAAPPSDLSHYPHDPARAQALLEAAGYPRRADGTRITLTLKTSTDETTRLLAAVLQQQLRAAGIQLQLRSAEFGTFYADVTHGAFQMYILKWVGSNEDPDIFRYMYASSSFPPKGANRGHYVNPQVDALLARAASETGTPAQIEAARRTDYIAIQKILSVDVPSVPLWFPQNELVHTARLTGLYNEPDGNFDYLRTARLR